MQRESLKQKKVWIAAKTWTTGKQPHLLKGLKAGKYRLVEMCAPKGYTKWDEPVYFTITDGMTEIPEVILRNYGTIVQVEKQDDTLKTHCFQEQSWNWCEKRYYGSDPPVDIRGAEGKDFLWTGTRKLYYQRTGSTGRI